MQRHLITGLGGLLLGMSAGAADRLPLDQITLPPGFTMEEVARVPGARAMTWGEQGTLFVGSNRGAVYALPAARNGKAKPVRIAEGLSQPIGEAFHRGALYVSAINRIVRFDGIEQRLNDPPSPKTVRADFPGARHHGGKFLGFGPDGRLYVPVGAPCNICEPDRQRFANIMRMRPDGSDLEVFATGIRNTVGFDWNPKDGSLWFTNNGRDWLGDDRPPDTLHRAATPGLDFGYPYCHAGEIADPEFGKKRACTDFESPARKLGAHVAPLGMRFYTGTQFPAAYRGQIFIAEHGSWNRSGKVGYRLTLVRVDGDKAVSYEPFATGWLQGDAAWGRPVDVLVAPDGSLLVSDDLAGAVYRIRYQGMKDR